MKTSEENNDELDFEKGEFSKLIEYFRKIESYKLSADFDKNFYKKLEHAKPKISFLKQISLIFTIKKGDAELKWFPDLLKYRLITAVSSGIIVISIILLLIFNPYKQPWHSPQQIAKNKTQDTSSKTQDTTGKTQDTSSKIQLSKHNNSAKEVKDIVNKDFDNVIFAEFVVPENLKYRGQQEDKEYIPGKLSEGETSSGDIKEGNGTYTWKDGTRFTGEFRNENLNGNGTMVYSNGNIFKGEWLDNQRNGKGTFTLKNKTTFSGIWKENDLNGQGILLKSNGERYKGEWKNGMADGKGIYIWANGDRYEGDWKFGMIEGKGTLTKTNGEKYSGVWKRNKLVVRH